MKLGIFGGTFNPPHNGHLSAARHVKDALHLDKIYFIPANIPPHKSLPRGSATSQQRCEMTRLMCQSESWAEVCTLELARSGPSYTIETVRQLYASGRWEHITLIVGTDMLLTLDSWREPAELFRLCTIAVVAREMSDWMGLQERASELHAEYDADIRLIEYDPLPISSTQLRRSGNFYEYVPPAVAAYIKRNGLYQ